MRGWELGLIALVLNHFGSNSKCHELWQVIEKMEQIAIVNISYHTCLLCTDRKNTVYVDT